MDRPEQKMGVAPYAMLPTHQEVKACILNFDEVHCKTLFEVLNGKKINDDVVDVRKTGKVVDDVKESVNPEVETVPKVEEIIPKVEEVVTPKIEEPVVPKIEEVAAPKVEEVVTPKVEEPVVPKIEEVAAPKVEEVVPKVEEPIVAEVIEKIIDDVKPAEPKPVIVPEPEIAPIEVDLTNVPLTRAEQSEIIRRYGLLSDTITPAK